MDVLGFCSTYISFLKLKTAQNAANAVRDRIYHCLSSSWSALLASQSPECGGPSHPLPPLPVGRQKGLGFIFILCGKFISGQHHGSYLLEHGWGMRFIFFEEPLPPGVGSPDYLRIPVSLHQPSSKMVGQGFGLFLLFESPSEIPQ